MRFLRRRKTQVTEDEYDRRLKEAEREVESLKRRVDVIEVQTTIFKRKTEREIRARST
jgi:3-keto-L-gulonate-6-phosphate decarboxylase